jgi:hypothetical protein
VPDPIVDAINRLRADVDSLLEREWPRYATGTWTPEFIGTTVAGVFTYTNQLGYYVQAGSAVFVWGRCSISAIGTPPTGNMRLKGLPITCGVTNVYNGTLVFSRISNFNYTAAALQLTGIILTGGTVVQLEESFDNIASVAVPAANFTNTGTDLIFYGTYLT